MSEGLDVIRGALQREAPEVSERTRRQFVGATAAALGGMGLVGVLPAGAKAASPNNTKETILNVAATAEVLATIVNTVGFRREVVLGGRDRFGRDDDDLLESLLGGLVGGVRGRGRARPKDPTQRNIGAAAQEELRHYDVLVSLGAKAITKSIWVPDAVFASRENLLNTLVVGDQIFVNAYLIGVGAFAKLDPKLAAVPAEFMGAEAVHRALALQSLGKLGNDRIFMKVEFTDILEAVARLKAAGFGFGERGAGPGRFYEFDDIRKLTPTDPDVNTPDITPIDA